MRPLGGSARRGERGDVHGARNLPRRPRQGTAVCVHPRGRQHQRGAAIPDAVRHAHYHLGEYEALRDAIGWFSGPNGRGANPFAASSLAAHNGWGTTSALDPANADPAVCRPGETPIECEYRLVKPAVALIMFGTNDSGGLPLAEFRANLDAIVRISLRMGVIRC